ncbi:hypothetical protein POM88_036039 [Heracleum sosnowskyi]|uniref:Splicing factor cactin central domain-containing protein n=1 Tax=Heracleum sosnowskyi TaxID=360622 RepID=A0AAD8MEI6_9APIA|nr:hypothetical protein POM88_036039 [Heracleum sosnowskyi]
METKRRHCVPDDAESSNENEYESIKQQRKKRKIIKSDMASKLAKQIKSCNANASSHLPLKIMYSVKEDSNKKRAEAFSLMRPTNKKNSHLSLKTMCSVKKDKRIERERMEEIEKVKRRVEKAIEERMAFSDLVCGHQLPAEFLGDERGLHLSIVANVMNLLQGKSYSDLELLQSKIESLMRSGLANVVDYWEAILKLINIYKGKACLKDILANLFPKPLGKDHRSLRNAGYDGMNDLLETEETEVTGSSCSPHLLHGEEIGDNFEMMTMGVMEEGDALSGNNDEGICQSQYIMEEGDALSGNNGEGIRQSQVYWTQKKCRLRKPKYFRMGVFLKKRFKCTFEREILYIDVNFKRNPYCR